MVTDAGLAAVGILSEPDIATGAPQATPKPKAKSAGSDGRQKHSRRVAVVSDTTVPLPEPSKDTKLGKLIAALRRKKGATIAELMEATGWQAHSVRGAISGALKKKLKLEVVSEAVEGRGRVYRIDGLSA